MWMPKKVPSTPIPEIKILMGGALEAPDIAVTPGVLSAIGLATSSNEKDPYSLTKEKDGRRLGLAQWIANPKNQLTARSIVNRVWQRHFGKPLAGNPNNFGAKGEKNPLIQNYWIGLRRILSKKVGNSNGFIN